MNAIDDEIKFTMISSDKSVQFLHTMVIIDNGTMKTVFYLSPTDRNNILRSESQHPRGMVWPLLYSQFLRVKQIVDDPEIAETRF